MSLAKHLRCVQRKRNSSRHNRCCNLFGGVDVIDSYGALNKATSRPGSRRSVGRNMIIILAILLLLFLSPPYRIVKVCSLANLVVLLERVAKHGDQWRLRILRRRAWSLHPSLRNTNNKKKTKA